MDIDRLAAAVAAHETCNCTCGTADRNNCMGIRRGGAFAIYSSKESSYEHFKRIWGDPDGYYRGAYPTIGLARKYSGNDRAEDWLRNVTSMLD